MSWSPPASDSLAWSPPDTDEPLGPEVKEEKQDGSFVDGLLRSLGLTARYAIEGGLGLADLAAEPIRMAERAILPEKWQPKGTGGQAIADLIGLPQPETGAEKVVGDISRAVAGAGGSAGGAQALAGKVVPQAQNAMAWLAAKPALQAQAATGAGIGASVARENEWGPWGSLAAQLAGGIAVPASIRAGRAAIEPVMDIGATIGASSGNQRGIRRLATDAVERGLVGEKESTRVALQNATEYVSGAKPTSAQAVAEANLKNTDKVFGGWLARLEKDLTGARGVEDVLPTTIKRQAAAIARAEDALDSTTAPLRNEVIEAVNAKVGGLSAKRLASGLDDLAATPEIAGDKMLSRAVQMARREVDRLQSGGRINAKAAYAFRKSFNRAVGKAAEATEGTLAQKDAKKIGWITHQVQLVIDDVMEEAAKAAGATKKWGEYLSMYSRGRRLIEAHTSRAEAAGEMASQVKPLGSNVVPGELPQPPTLLNRKMMFANWGLRLLGKDANAPVVEELTKRLSDPKAFAELLSRPSKDPLRIWALEAIRRGEQSAGMGLITNSDTVTK